MSIENTSQVTLQKTISWPTTPSSAQIAQALGPETVQEIRENTSQVTLQKIISKLPTTLSSAQIAQALSLQPETVQEIREGAIGKVAVSAVCKVIEYLWWNPKTIINAIITKPNLSEQEIEELLNKDIALTTNFPSTS